MFYVSYTSIRLGKTAILFVHVSEIRNSSKAQLCSSAAPSGLHQSHSAGIELVAGHGWTFQNGWTPQSVAATSCWLGNSAGVVNRLGGFYYLSSIRLLGLSHSTTTAFQRIILYV